VHTLEQKGTALSNAMIPAPHKLAQQDVTLSADSGRAIPETMQNVRILPDEDFDEVLRAYLQLMKQVWDDMKKVEKSFTPVINKSQRKNIKQLARSICHIS
jgi:hypothetical protein